MASKHSTPPRGFTDKFIDSLSATTTRIELPDKAAPGLRLRVSPTGTKTFIWRYVENGKSKVYTIGTYGDGDGCITLKKARDELGKKKAAHKAGVSLTSPADTPKTVKELGEKFYNQRIVPHRKVPEAVRGILDRDIYPAIGTRKLNTLTAPAIAHVVEKVVDRGASTHAGKVLQILKQMFRFAEGRGYIDHSPAYALDKKDLGCVDNMKDRYLTVEEIRIVWHTIDAAPLLSIQARLGLKILLLTGVRTAELQLAEWKHIDFDKAEWFIPEANSKTTSWTVPLTPAVVELLEILKDAADPSPWVMASPKSKSKDGRLTSKVFGRAVRRLFNLKDADGNPLMDIPSWSPHDLRRTIRTHMDDLRIEPHIAEKCLNHSLGRIEKTYNRNDLLDNRREALEKWADFVDLVVRDRDNVTLLSKNRGVRDMDTRTFYKRGIDSWTLRQSLRHRVRISTARRGESSSVAARVDMLIDQKRQLEEAWARAPKPQSIQDEELYKKDMAEHDTAIKHLEQLATSAMIDQLLSGNTIGLGYLSRSTLQPIPIPISEWAFLELDMRKSIATFEDGTGYKAVRFLEKGDLSAEEKMWVDSLLCVDELSEIKQESADILPTLEEDRLNQIIETADSLNLDLNNLRRNDKQKIENKCSLTASTFKRIWQYGRDKGVIK